MIKWYQILLETFRLDIVIDCETGQLTILMPVCKHVKHFKFHNGRTKQKNQETFVSYATVLMYGWGYAKPLRGDFQPANIDLETKSSLGYSRNLQKHDIPQRVDQSITVRRSELHGDVYTARTRTRQHLLSLIMGMETCKKVLST